MERLQGRVFKIAAANVSQALKERVLHGNFEELYGTPEGTNARFNSPWRDRALAKEDFAVLEAAAGRPDLDQGPRYDLCRRHRSAGWSAPGDL